MKVGKKQFQLKKYVEYFDSSHGLYLFSKYGKFSYTGNNKLIFRSINVKLISKVLGKSPFTGSNYFFFFKAEAASSYFELIEFLKKYSEIKFWLHCNNLRETFELEGAKIGEFVLDRGLFNNVIALLDPFLKLEGTKGKSVNELNVKQALLAPVILPLLNATRALFRPASLLISTLYFIYLIKSR